MKTIYGDNIQCINDALNEMSGYNVSDDTKWALLAIVLEQFGMALGIELDYKFIKEK